MSPLVQWTDLVEGSTHAVIRVEYGDAHVIAVSGVFMVLNLIDP